MSYKYFMSHLLIFTNTYVPGSDLGAGDKVVNNTESLPSQDLFSIGADRPTNK